MAPKRATKAAPKKAAAAPDSGVKKTGRRATAASTPYLPGERKSRRQQELSPSPPPDQPQASRPAARQTRPKAARATKRAATPEPTPTSDPPERGQEPETAEEYLPALTGEPLHQISGETQITFRDAPATLGHTLTIRNTRQHTDLFLGYSFNVTINGTHAGHIDAWRISKPTTAHPNTRINAPWMTHLVGYQLDDIDENGRDEDPIAVLQHESALWVQALFTRSGTVRGPVLQAAKGPLRDLPAIYIQLITVEGEFQRGGLLEIMLDQFYEALTGLPEWFAFHEGIVVLVPDRPTGDETWETASDRVVKAKLVDIYERHEYAVWRRGAKIASTVSNYSYDVTVMGRLLP